MVIEVRSRAIYSVRSTIFALVWLTVPYSDDLPRNISATLILLNQIIFTIIRYYRWLCTYKSSIAPTRSDKLWQSGAMTVRSVRDQPDRAISCPPERSTS